MDLDDYKPAGDFDRLINNIHTIPDADVEKAAATIQKAIDDKKSAKDILTIATTVIGSLIKFVPLILMLVLLGCCHCNDKKKPIAPNVTAPVPETKAEVVPLENNPCHSAHCPLPKKKHVPMEADY
jgi:hypothetical protein